MGIHAGGRSKSAAAPVFNSAVEPMVKRSHVLESGLRTKTAAYSARKLVRARSKRFSKARSASGVRCMAWAVSYRNSTLERNVYSFTSNRLNT